jgi:hypothetical protein
LTFNGLHTIISQKIELFILNVERKKTILAEREAVVGLSVDWKL